MLSNGADFLKNSCYTDQYFGSKALDKRKIIQILNFVRFSSLSGTSINTKLCIKKRQIIPETYKKINNVNNIVASVNF